MSTVITGTSLTHFCLVISRAPVVWVTTVTTDYLFCTKDVVSAGPYMGL